MKAVIEIPKGSVYKYEVNKDTGGIEIDRVISIPVPTNYGYIPDTLAPDNDPLDVFIVGKHSIPPLTTAKIVVFGVFKCIDKGEQDDKVIAYIAGDTITDWNTEVSAIKYYLENYKHGFQVLGFEGATQAMDLIAALTLP